MQKSLDISLPLFSPNLITRIERQQPIRRERGSNQRRLSNNNNTIENIRSRISNCLLARQNARDSNKIPSPLPPNIIPSIQNQKGIDTSGQSSKARKIVSWNRIFLRIIYSVCIKRILAFLTRADIQKRRKNNSGVEDAWLAASDYIMWEWTEGVRNGPIRLSHLITTVATTTLLHYLRYLGPLPASLYRIYLGEELEPRHKGLLEEGGFEMILSDLHPLPPSSPTHSTSSD